MSEYERACIADGIRWERQRIYDLIANLPLGECRCERWLTEMYTHADTCDWNNEYAYRSKLLDAITTPAKGDAVPASSSAGAAADVSGLEASEASGA